MEGFLKWRYPKTSSKSLNHDLGGSINGGTPILGWLIKGNPIYKWMILSSNIGDIFWVDYHGDIMEI
jgi:hypothetical protein